MQLRLYALATSAAVFLGVLSASAAVTHHRQQRHHVWGQAAHAYNARCVFRKNGTVASLIAGQQFR